MKCKVRFYKKGAASLCPNLQQQSLQSTQQDPAVSYKHSIQITSDLCAGAGSPFPLCPTRLTRLILTTHGTQ